MYDSAQNSGLSQWKRCERQFPELPLHFRIQPERQKDETHLMQSQGCMVDVHDTPLQIASIRLPSVGLCGVLAQWDFNLFGRLKNHVGGHR
jgi:hypothetical protein